MGLFSFTFHQHNGSTHSNVGQSNSVCLHFPSMLNNVFAGSESSHPEKPGRRRSRVCLLKHLPVGLRGAVVTAHLRSLVIDAQL